MCALQRKVRLGFSHLETNRKERAGKQTWGGAGRKRTEKEMVKIQIQLPLSKPQRESQVEELSREIQTSKSWLCLLGVWETGQ